MKREIRSASSKALSAGNPDLAPHECRDGVIELTHLLAAAA
jgi:hypothetical protein